MKNRNSVSQKGTVSLFICCLDADEVECDDAVSNNDHFIERLLLSQKIGSGSKFGNSASSASPLTKPGNMLKRCLEGAWT
jgi:hypothetical protein